MAVIVETIMDRDIELGTGATSKTHPSGGVLDGYQVSLSTLSTGGVSSGATTLSWEPGAVASASKESTTVTVQGSALGDFAIASFSLNLQGTTLSAEVSAANTVTVTVSNSTGGEKILGLGDVRVLVFKTR